MSDAPLILTVDHNSRNQELLAQVLQRHGYRVLQVLALADLDQVLESPEGVSLALVDIGGFDRTVWDRCERLRAERIPFLVLSPRHSVAIQQASLSHGARGVAVKPLAIRDLLGLIEAMLEK